MQQYPNLPTRSWRTGFAWHPGHATSAEAERTPNTLWLSYEAYAKGWLWVADHRGHLQPINGASQGYGNQPGLPSTMLHNSGLENQLFERVHAAAQPIFVSADCMRFPIPGETTIPTQNPIAPSAVKAKGSPWHRCDQTEWEDAKEHGPLRTSRFRLSPGSFKRRKNAQAAGFDAFELPVPTATSLNQFLSTYFNQRGR